MTKRVEIKGSNLTKANDKEYVFSTYEYLLELLFKYSNIIKNVQFGRSPNEFYLSFNIKICQTGDLLWILFKEFLQTIKETEENVELSISEVDEGNKSGVTYKFYKYIPNE